MCGANEKSSGTTSWECTQKSWVTLEASSYNVRKATETPLHPSTALNGSYTIWVTVGMHYLHKLMYIISV